MNRLKNFVAVVAIMVVLTGCSKDPVTFDYFYFDTSMSITIYDADRGFDSEAVDSEIDETLNRLENTYSPTIKTSTLSKINNGEDVEVDDEFIEILERSIDACNATDGRYDPTSGTLIDLWSINNDNYLPTNAEIKAALKKVDCNKVEISDNHISMPDGYKLDFGSSIKGYSADLIEDILVENGVTSAMINLGGNIQAVGDKIGNPFNIGVMKPDIYNFTNANAFTMQIEDTAVVTSGINQRFFERDGKIYHHIINANEGRPADNELASVSIITDSGADADILSTAVFIMGLDEGYDFVMQQDGVDAIFITRDNKVYQTKDFNLQFTDDEYELATM